MWHSLRVKRNLTSAGLRPGFNVQTRLEEKFDSNNRHRIGRYEEASQDSEPVRVTI